MNKMMRILKAGLVVLFLAFVIVPNEVCAQLNNTFSNPYGHNLIGDENGSFVSSNQPNSGSNKASTSSESSVQAGNMPGTEGFRDLKSNESASDIFVILQKKIYGTLVDLRQIVYVIAGFGLVMFAVAAIFNKISYKHLGYIMIGLSLLSLMFPFLEYFSGYNVEKAKQKQLTFSNFLAASDYAIIRGTLDSDLANPTGEGQPPMTEEELAARRAEAQKNAGILAGVDTSALTTGVTGPKMETKLAGQEQRDKIIKAGCSPATMKGAWNPETMTRKLCSVGGDGTILTNTETCQGKLKNGECTKTAGQIFNDIWKTGQDVVQIGLGAGLAFNSGVGAIIDTAAGAQGVGNILNSNMGFFDKINAISNLTSNTWGSNGAVTNDLNMIIGGLIGMTQNAGSIGTTWSTNLENNTSGTNPFTTLMGLLGGYGTTAQGAITTGGGYISTGTHYGNSVHDTANNVNAIFSRFGGEGSTLKSRWQSVFGNGGKKSNGSGSSRSTSSQRSRTGSVTSSGSTGRGSDNVVNGARRESNS